MKRFAVSSTFHMIDVCDLDSTSLSIVQARNEEDAVRRVLAEDRLAMDAEFYDEYQKGEQTEKDLPGTGLTKAVLGLNKKAFLAKRRKAWMKAPLTKSATSTGDYPFHFDDQDGRSGGVYGLKALEIPE